MRKTKLLIVDDEPGMRRTLGRIMKAKGCEVRVAEDGVSAIAAAEAYSPDIVLLDIRMPGIDGVETWRQLKGICPKAVAIFMTAYASSERTSDARNEGAIEVLSKPVDVDLVCQFIQRRQRPVLIVDDDPGFRESLERALQRLGFRVDTAADGDAALKVFRQSPHSVVLLDMKLQGASGLEVLKNLRQQFDKVPVILMTGFSELKKEMEAGLTIGAVSTLTKPFDIDELVSEVSRRAEAIDAQ